MFSFPSFRALALLALLSASLWAEEPLVVATREVPPFAMKDEATGRWQGLSIDLWSQVADELGLAYEVEEVSLEEMVDGVAEGRFDASVGALTITSDRERLVDFSHSFYDTGLGIAAPKRSAAEPDLQALAGAFISWQFLSALLALVVVLFGAGTAVWLFERKANGEQFGGEATRGIGNGFWWSAVTMTTVGYGDKAPITLGGRVVGLVWMFTSVIIISSFTASIASSLTVSSIVSGIEGPDDLPGVRVGTVTGSTSEAYLEGRRARVIGFENLATALAAAARGDVEAVVFDEAPLRYVARDFAQLAVLPVVFEKQNYGFAFSSGSALRGPANVALLETIRSDAYVDILRRYGLE